MKLSLTQYIIDGSVNKAKKIISDLSFNINRYRTENAFICVAITNRQPKILQIILSRNDVHYDPRISGMLQVAMYGKKRPTTTLEKEIACEMAIMIVSYKHWGEGVNEHNYFSNDIPLLFVITFDFPIQTLYMFLQNDDVNVDVLYGLHQERKDMVLRFLFDEPNTYLCPKEKHKRFLMLTYHGASMPDKVPYAYIAYLHYKKEWTTITHKYHSVIFKKKVKGLLILLRKIGVCRDLCYYLINKRFNF